MSCQEVKKKIPLLAGNELSPRKAKCLNAHLEKCSACQKEWQEYREILGKIKALARSEEGKDWEETEWKQLIKKITSEKIEKRAFQLKLAPKQALAFGIMFLVICGGVALFINIFFIRPKELTPLKPLQPEILANKEEPQIAKKEKTAEAPALITQQILKKPSAIPSLITQAQKPASPQPKYLQKLSPDEKEAQQDVLSMTFVSQETGLRIVWFFNKNFEWEDKK